MKKLHEIVITPTINQKYAVTITLLRLKPFGYNVIVTTNHENVVNEYEKMYTTYEQALDEYLENIKIYSKHTALMNL